MLWPLVDRSTTKDLRRSSQSGVHRQVRHFLDLETARYAARLLGKTMADKTKRGMRLCRTPSRFKRFFALEPWYGLQLPPGTGMSPHNQSIQVTCLTWAVKL